MKTELVNFYGNQILCVTEGEKILVAIKPICEGLGLDGDRAIKTLTDDEILGDERSEQTVHVPGDRARNMVCLPLEFINGWLFQIKFSNTMSDETKAALVRYKRECYKILYGHFFRKTQKQLEANKIEIDLLKELNDLNEKKGYISDAIKEKKKLLEKIREERLSDEPTLF
jgi:hypothetical protein